MAQTCTKGKEGKLSKGGKHSGIKGNSHGDKDNSGLNFSGGLLL